MNERRFLFILVSTVSCMASAPADDPLDVANALEQAVSNAIEKAQPSVVAITRIRSENGETLAIKGREPAVGVEGQGQPPPGAFGDGAANRPGFPNPGDDLMQQPPAPEYYALPGDFGSGVVVGERGEIVTTYHLVRGAKQLRVRARNAVFDAEILAADPRTDLAVIVPRPGSETSAKLVALPIADVSKLRQGAFLVGLGNPYNVARDGRASASLGILANVARRLEPPSGSEPNIKQFFRFQPTLLQLDSKLNLGISGGAVINLKGELVGVTTAEASPSGFDAAAGYAIPMDALGRRALQTLMQGKEVEYAFIGIALSQQPNEVRNVQEGTPAWKAGLATGDIILTVGDQELAPDESALPMALAAAPVGRPVKLRVRHQGQVVERTIVMSKYPVDRQDVIATNRPPPWRGAQIDFTSVLGDGRNTRITLEVMAIDGVGVVDVASGSAVEAAGIAKGYVVTAVEGKSISTPAEFREAAARHEGKPLRLTVFDGLQPGREITVPPK